MYGSQIPAQIPVPLYLSVIHQPFFQVVCPVLADDNLFRGSRMQIDYQTAVEPQGNVFHSFPGYQVLAVCPEERLGVRHSVSSSRVWLRNSELGLPNPAALRQEPDREGNPYHPGIQSFV